MTKFWIATHGCEQRQMDADRVQAFLLANGAEQSDSAQTCDLAVVVTCGVDRQNEAKSKALVDATAAQLAEGAKLVIGGCLPSITPSAFSHLSVEASFSPRTLDSLDALLGENLRVPMASVPDVSGKRSYSLAPVYSARDAFEAAKAGYKIRIDQGCLLSCSYCMIRSATGRLESIDPAVLLGTYVAARGEPSVLLVGGDTGAYGSDIGTSLPQLLEAMLATDGPPLFVHDCNVNWLLRDLPSYQQVLGNDAEGRVKAMTFPVQSGSDPILKAMKRPYRSQATIAGLQKIQSPSLAMGTHVIVGFPGETEDDFDATRRLLDRVGFDFITCFGYSEHALAPSAKLPGKIDSETIARRAILLKEQWGERVRVYL